MLDEYVCPMILLKGLLLTTHCRIVQVRQILSGLDYLHDNDIIHGDLRGVRLGGSPGSDFCDADVLLIPGECLD